MKTISALLFMVALSVGVAFGQSTNPNALVGRAHQEVGSCIGQAQQEFQGDIQHEVAVVGSCFAGGFLYRVTFYHITFGAPCIPVEDDCHPPLPIFQGIATVDFDCSGNVIGSECQYQQ